MKKTRILFLLTIFVLLLSSCKATNDTAKSEKQTEKGTIKVGTTPGPYSELFIKGIQPILEKEGYSIEITEFQDVLQADMALAEGAIELNVDQHTAYLENFNANKDANLVGITPIPTVPAGLFPGRKKTLDELSEGDTIGIPDDASNAARAYLLLQKAGIIQLKEGIDPIKATAKDIEKNPKKIEIIEMSSAQIPRSLEDLDFGVIPGSIVYSSGIDPKTSLLSEDVVKQYELVATIDKKNQDTDWAKAVVQAYQSNEFKKFLEKENTNNYWFIPEELK